MGTTDRIRNGLAGALAVAAALVTVRAAVTRIAPEFLTGEFAEPDPIRALRTVTALLAFHVILRVDGRGSLDPVGWLPRGPAAAGRLLAGAVGGMAGLTAAGFSIALAWPRYHGHVSAEMLPAAAVAGALVGVALAATVLHLLVLGLRTIGLVAAPGAGRRLTFVVAAGLGAWLALELDPAKEWALPRAVTPLTALVGGAGLFVLLASTLPLWRATAGRRRAVAVAAPLLATAVIVLATTPGALPVGEVAPGMPRAVLLVTIDTLRADHVHAYGYDRETTPRIDALAGESVLFEHAFAPMPTTDASHTAILTGLHPRSTGVMANGYPVTRPGGVTTLADWFRDRGYRTGAISSRVYLDPVTLNWGSGFQTFSAPARETMAADVTLGRARSWLDRHGDAPFFLWVHFWDPHGPYDPPRDPERSMFVDTYHGEFHKRGDRRKNPYTPAEIAYATGLYDGEIRYADDHAGRLIDTVRERFGRENVLVVLLSDHGEAMAEFEADYGWSFAHSSLLAPATIGVPFMISWPGRLPEGRRVASPVSTVSVTPTVTDLLGEALEADEPSLVPLLRSSDPETPGPAPAFAERRVFPDPPRRRPWLGLPEFAVAEGRYVLVDNKKRGRFLYDLVADPSGTRNLADENPDVVERLTRRIIQFRTRPRVEPSTEEWTAGKREALHGLTYVR